MHLVTGLAQYWQPFINDCIYICRSGNCFISRRQAAHLRFQLTSSAWKQIEVAHGMIEKGPIIEWLLYETTWVCLAASITVAHLLCFSQRRICYLFLKPETHRPNRWTSEAFGETREFWNKSIRCVQLRWKLLEQLRSTCEVWERWLLAVWAIGYSDWRCASKSAWCVGGAEYCFSMHSILSFPVFMFWMPGTRLAPPNVKETYCISSKRRAYTLLWSRQLSKRYDSMQLFCRTGQTRGNGVVG